VNSTTPASALSEMSVGVEFTARPDVPGVLVSAAWLLTERVLRGTGTAAWLGASGWSVLRFTALNVLRTPDAMAAQVGDAILRRSRGPVS